MQGLATASLGLFCTRTLTARLAVAESVAAMAVCGACCGGGAVYCVLVCSRCVAELLHCCCTVRLTGMDRAGVTV